MLNHNRPAFYMVTPKLFEALVEWNALDGSVKEVLKKFLKKRLEQPRLPGAELRGDLRDCYKIKLLKQGYRLVYQVEDDGGNWGQTTIIA